MANSTRLKTAANNRSTHKTNNKTKKRLENSMKTKPSTSLRSVSACKEAGSGEENDKEKVKHRALKTIINKKGRVNNMKQEGN